MLIRYRMAVLSGLAGDFVFFAVLVSAFFVRQSAGHIDPSENYVSDWHPLAARPILWIDGCSGSSFSFCSSTTSSWMRHPDRNRAKANLFATETCCTCGSS